MGISGTMPYIYPELPDVHTMTLFNSVSLPYSLKFLLGTMFINQPLSYKNIPASSTGNAKHGLSSVNC